MNVFWLVVSLLGVTLGAEALVRGASQLARRFGVSPLFIGLTIVAFGTSSPELAASLTASLRGAEGVAVGNVIGSNIFNVAVILGIAALIHPIRVRLSMVRRDVLVAMVAAAAPWASLVFGGRIPRTLGVLFVGALVAYLVSAYRIGRAARPDETALVEADRTAATSSSGPWSDRVWTNVGLIIAGLTLLVFASGSFVTSALNLARAAGMSELAIGLTIVAAGTSLPELVTSAVAGLRGSPDIAVGNVIGSNIFNVFGILGVSSIVHPLALEGRVLTLDIPVMLLATAALIPIIRTGGVISRWEGALLLVAYGAYVIVLL